MRACVCVCAVCVRVRDGHGALGAAAAAGLVGRTVGKPHTRTTQRKKEEQKTGEDDDEREEGRETTAAACGSKNCHPLFAVHVHACRCTAWGLIAIAIFSLHCRKVRGRGRDRTQM